MTGNRLEKKDEMLIGCRIDAENQFSDWQDLVSKGRIADAVVVAVLVSLISRVLLIRYCHPVVQKYGYSGLLR